MQKLKATISVGLIIGIFLTIVIALSLLPSISDLSIGVSENASLTNITGITRTLLSLVPVFFIIGVVLLLVAGMKITGKGL